MSLEGFQLSSQGAPITKVSKALKKDVFMDELARVLSELILTQAVSESLITERILSKICLAIKEQKGYKFPEIVDAIIESHLRIKDPIDLEASDRSWEEKIDLYLPVDNFPNGAK